MSMKSYILKNLSTLIEPSFSVVKYNYYLLQCYREANKVADSLAKMGRLQEEPIAYFVTPYPALPIFWMFLLLTAQLAIPL